VTPPRLSQGDRVGPYEVTGALGAGGMGEVYRARDTRLGRDVALKVLPAALAADAERLARFTREAQVLASLNDAGIAAIFGLEESGDTKALVLELVEGPTLAERIAQGPIPLDEALETAAAIATALDAAHEHGIVHRDLKPANVKIRPDGVVKVLDFGLAKALDASSGFGVDIAQSPTLTAQATRTGIILGTAAYMAPEQAKGKAVDRRADIWAFGVVLFEMLTGKRLFDGETPSEVLAAVILKEPDLTPLPDTTPPHVRHLLARCLERDPKKRLRDIGEAWLALRAPDNLVAVTSGGTRVPAAASAAAPEQARGASRGLIAALALALAGALGVIAWLSLRVEPRPVARYDIQPPKQTSFSLVDRPGVALSPDGKTLAYVAVGEGVTRLYLRPRDQVEARAVPGSEGASNPVFSPDGRWIAFFSDNQLRKTSTDGAAIGLAPVSDPRGIAWIDAANILYSPEPAAGLFRVAINGGQPAEVTHLDAAAQERTHRWPDVLPGGASALFVVGKMGSPDNYDSATLAAVDLKTGNRKVVLQGAAMARFVAPDSLVYARAGTLYGIRFDPNTLETHGMPVALVQGVAVDTPSGATHFAFADDGTLAYITGSDQSGRTISWVDREGHAQPVGLPPGLYNDPRLSPDRTRMAVAAGSTGSSDVWVYDFARTTFTRLTFTGVNGTPIWSHDGRSILFAGISPTGFATKILRVPADGSKPPEQVVEVPVRAYLGPMTPDGGAVIAVCNDSQGKSSNVVRIPLVPGQEPTPIAATEWDEYNPTLSPDGRYVAYQSNDTGREDIYVRDVGGAGSRWQVSTSGGEEPSWSADGTEMYYRSEDRLMVVPVQTRGTFSMGVPHLLFSGVFQMRSDTGISYDVDSAHHRFLMIRLPSDGGADSNLHVVLNWHDDLERLLTAAR
jgi:serine/threonine-protein kinase